MNELLSISPVDGRYLEKTKELADFFSEYALIKYRVTIEVKWLLYLIDNKIVGYLNYYLMYEKIEIANFNVLEKYQNKGIGTKLIKYLIDNYSNVDNITLEVKSDNNKAIHLYEKMGFKRTAIREKYYHGIDGILMERDMKK